MVRCVLWREREEVPDHVGVRQIRLRIALLSVDKVRKLYNKRLQLLSVIADHSYDSGRG